MLELGKFKKTDINNEYFKPDLDVTKMFESFTEKISIPLTNILAAPAPDSYTNDEYPDGINNPEYIEAARRHEQNATRLTSDMFKIYMKGVNEAIVAYPKSLADAD